MWERALGTIIYSDSFLVPHVAFCVFELCMLHYFCIVWRISLLCTSKATKASYHGVMESVFRDEQLQRCSLGLQCWDARICDEITDWAQKFEFLLKECSGIVQNYATKERLVNKIKPESFTSHHFILMNSYERSIKFWNFNCQCWQQLLRCYLTSVANVPRSYLYVFTKDF